jgi:hypothetical protein
MHRNIRQDVHVEKSMAAKFSKKTPLDTVALSGGWQERYDAIIFESCMKVQRRAITKASMCG